MKTLYALLIATILATSGCANLSSAPFDPVEYNHVVELAFVVKYAEKTCGTPEAPNTVIVAKHKAALIDIYVSHRPQHEKIKEVTTIIKNNIEEMSDAYAKGTPSTAYCKGKFKIMDASLAPILDALGGLPK